MNNAQPEKERFRKTDTDAARSELTAVERSSRVFQKDSTWYFATREGILVGPYRKQFDAELSASLLIARLAQLDPGADARSEIHRFLQSERSEQRNLTPAPRKPQRTRAAPPATGLKHWWQRFEGGAKRARRKLSEQTRLAHVSLESASATNAR